MIKFFTYCIFKISSPYIRHQFLQTNFITMTDGDNWFRISQIRILKNFIETKINFSPSPLWFSKSVLWVLAPTFHMTLVQSPLCLYSSMYILREKKKKNPIQQVILAQSTHTTVLLCWHILTFTQTLISVRANVFTYELIHNGF